MGNCFIILNVLVAKSRAVSYFLYFISHTLPFFLNNFFNTLFNQLLDFDMCDSWGGHIIIWLLFLEGLSYLAFRWTFAFYFWAFLALGLLSRRWCLIDFVVVAFNKELSVSDVKWRDEILKQVIVSCHERERKFLREALDNEYIRGGVVLEQA